MEKTTSNKCKTCKYKMWTSYGIACDYLSQTGKMRNCEVGYCDKYEKRKVKVATQ